jgi:hypothetical protein
MQMRTSIFKRTVHPIDICVKNQIKKTHHRLRARGDNNNKIINLIIMQMNYII